MDHDNKVKIQKPEVKLFLPENLYPITKSSPQIYDLEDEYAKTRKNKSFFIPLLMTGLCLFVGLLTFGVTKYIDYKSAASPASRSSRPPRCAIRAST